MWYFSQSGETSGPISEADLDARIAAGSLPPTVNVWREGMAGWLPYDQVRPVAAPAAPAVPPVVRPALRVSAAPVAVSAAPLQMQPEYADAGAGQGGAADVQGSSRLESASSWGMILIVGLAMFVFIGILASRPRDIGSAGNAAGLVDEADSFDADVELKGGSIIIENTSDFAWPKTWLSFRSGVTRYNYQLEGLPKDGKATIPLTEFTGTRGVKFAPTSPSSNPRELTIRVKDHGTATAELGRGR